MKVPPFVPEMASKGANDFEFLFWYLTGTTGAVGLLVYLALLYFCIRYRRGATRNPDGTVAGTPRILGSMRLELAWTVMPLFAFLSYFAVGVYVYNRAVHPPEDAMEIFVIGKQWMWKAQYPNGQRVIIGGNPRNMTEAERKSIGKLVLPIDRPVKLTLTSEDVIHDFGVPAFRAKIDVLPGRWSQVWYHPNKLGTYDIFCDQYCGTWHSLMVGKIAVVDGNEFDAWLSGYSVRQDGEMPQGTKNPVDGSLAQKGEQLFLKLQCIRCHSATPTGKAPVLERLYGSRVPLKGGGAEIADDAYITESIRRPRLKVVDGWEAIMPAYDESQVTADELPALIAYIRSLSKGTTPLQNGHFPAPNGAPTSPEARTQSRGN
jgi:cytochrome c oxidase subunit 2